MAAEKLLTEAACKNTKPKKEVYYLNDGAGLRLRIRPDGSRSWLYRFRIDGKENTSSLGPYPEVGLQAAREKRLAAKKHVELGVNPSTAKRLAKVQQIIKGETTFGLIAQDWILHNKKDWSSHHFERNEGLLRRFLLPKLEKLPIDSITEPLLFNILKPIYDSGIKESAIRTRAIAAQIFSFARATHRGTTNPAKDMADNPYFKKPKVKHFKALPQVDVGKLIKELDKTDDKQQLDIKTVCGLRMALYTGLRDNSIRGALWEEIDFERSIWTVPASRMKNRKVHQVPLPRQALIALNTLKPLTFRTNKSPIFPSNGKYGVMSENTLRLALHRLGFKVTNHGTRSLITDVLNENGFNSDAIERQLAHKEPSQVRRAYLRSDFMDERIKMMQWFADWCDEQASGRKKKANVTKLKAVE
jgi:integrase